MPTKKLAKSEQAVVDLVTNHPGDNSSAIVWRKLGGGFSNGRAVGTLNGVTPAQLVVALKIPARVSKLANNYDPVKGTSLHRGSGAINRIINDSSDEGYWPSQAAYRSYRANKQRASMRPVQVNQGVARSEPVAAPKLVDPDVIKSAASSLIKDLGL